MRTLYEFHIVFLCSLFSFLIKTRSFLPDNTRKEEVQRTDETCVQFLFHACNWRNENEARKKKKKNQRRTYRAQE